MNLNISVFGRGDFISVKFFESSCLIKHITPPEHLSYRDNFEAGDT